MKKWKSKIIAYLLVNLLSTSLTGCKNAESVEANEKAFSIENDFSDLFLQDIMLANDNSNDEVEVEPEVEYELSNVIVSNAKTPIISSLDASILGYFPEGRTLEIVDKIDGYYVVDYYGKEAYVKDDKADLLQVYDIKSPIKKVMYATSDLPLIIPEFLREEEMPESVIIPEFECFEVYQETDLFYLVKTDDYIGYIAKDNVKDLNGTFVVVDISNQELKLYKDNEVIKKCPVVTGTPTKSRETDVGAWNIFDISYNRALIGPGYESPVDIMLKFHNGEGLHDAEYHSCDFWKKKGKSRHGWRSQEEFGGDTYLKDGSHGCVNMRHDDVFEVAEYLNLGDAVLVKK